MNKLIDQDTITPWGVLPFKLQLSFAMIFDYWKQQAKNGSKGEAAAAKEVLAFMEDYPELKAPVTNYKIIEKYPEALDKLLSVLFPKPLQDNEIKSVIIPFTNITFHSTNRFKGIMERAGKDFKLEMRNIEADLYYLFACMFILSKKYGVNLKQTRPYFLDIPDTINNTMHHYRAMLNGDFSEIEPIDPSFSISNKDLEILRSNANNIDTWKKIIPPESFTFKGFGLMTLFDVTQDEIISGIKSDLLHPEALYSLENLDAIKLKLRRIFNMPNLETGIFIFDKTENTLNNIGHLHLKSLLINHQEEVSVHTCLCVDSEAQLISEDPIIYSDLSAISPKNHPQVSLLLSQGIRSYAAIPVPLDDGHTGVVELGSSVVGEINSVSLNNIKDILPIFTVALQRWMVDQETMMEAIIQENFTAIHPTVSWRFFEIAQKTWRARQLGKEAPINDIVFENVTPLYGQSDIVGSSGERNLATQKDLVKQLESASAILIEALTVEPLILYKQLSHRIDEARKHLMKSIDVGDEISLSNFLNTEIYPVFKHIRTLNDSMDTLVKEYESQLDPEMGFVYKKRKAFEVSVARINQRLAQYLDKQQVIAQKIYPHYFEKYKTDGVEYNIYLGQSLVKRQEYDPVYLQNLQLWQLQTMVGMERLVDKLQPELPLKLQTASLILVHGSPITVKFKMSSKVFDVEGAYNIRYEILKKRIDKAYVKGTEERLTLPGKIAIVYAQDQDAENYLRYLNYLLSQQLIHPNIENLDLEDLQGVSGLRALRVTVVK